jgi:protein gp37
MRFTCSTDEPVVSVTYALRPYVMTIVRNCPDDQFFFITKCPDNIRKWGAFPDNAWVGVSCLNAQQVWLAIEALKEVKAKHKWLSLEPLQGDIFAPTWELNRDFVGIDWAVIGGQTKPNVLPKIEWVKAIVEAADDKGIPVFLKDNLKPLFEGKPEPPWMAGWENKPGELRQELPK